MTATVERWDGQLGLTGEHFPAELGRPIRGEPIRCAVRGCHGHTEHVGSRCKDCAYTEAPPCGFWGCPPGCTCRITCPERRTREHDPGKPCQGCGAPPGKHCAGDAVACTWGPECPHHHHPN